MESYRPEVKESYTSHTDCVETVCFSPDQTKLCSAGDDMKVILTNLQTNKTEKVFSFHEGFFSYFYGSDFSFDGIFLVTGIASSSIDAVSLLIFKVSGSESGNPTKFKGHSNDVNCVQYFRKDSNHVISGSDDETIKIWNVERKKEISTLGCESYILSVDILPDNQTLVCGENRKVGIWDLRSRKCVQTLDHFNVRDEHDEDVNSVQFHPNSFSLASGCGDGSIKIFDFRTFKLLQEFKDDFPVISVCFHPSGKYLLSGGQHVKIFDLSEKKVLFTLEEHSRRVQCVKFSPVGKLFASGSWDEKVFLWNFPLGKMIRDQEKDIDEEERVKYLVEQCLLLDGLFEDKFCERNNVLKIRINNFVTLHTYKFFCL